MVFSRYDEWLTTEPDYSPAPLPHCSTCGSFLSRDSERTEHRVHLAVCPGSFPTDFYVSRCGESGYHSSHNYEAQSWVEYFRTCKRCHTINKEVDI